MYGKYSMERMNFRLSATGSILKGIKRNGWEEISLMIQELCKLYILFLSEYIFFFLSDDVSALSFKFSSFLNFQGGFYSKLLQHGSEITHVITQSELSNLCVEYGIWNSFSKLLLMCFLGYNFMQQFWSSYFTYYHINHYYHFYDGTTKSKKREIRLFS